MDAIELFANTGLASAPRTTLQTEGSDENLFLHVDGIHGVCEEHKIIISIDKKQASSEISVCSDPILLRILYFELTCWKALK